MSNLITFIWKIMLLSKSSRMEFDLPMKFRNVENKSSKIYRLAVLGLNRFFHSSKRIMK